MSIVYIEEEDEEKIIPHGTKVSDQKAHEDLNKEDVKKVLKDLAQILPAEFKAELQKETKNENPFGENRKQ